MTTAVAVWTQRTFGLLGLGSLVTYKAYYALGIGELVSTAFERIREVVDTVDEFEERYHSVKEKYNEGEYDLAIMLAAAITFLLVFFWPTVQKRRKKAFWSS